MCGRFYSKTSLDYIHGNNRREAASDNESDAYGSSKMGKTALALQMMGVLLGKNDAFA